MMSYFKVSGVCFIPENSFSPKRVYYVLLISENYLLMSWAINQPCLLLLFHFIQFWMKYLKCLNTIRLWSVNLFENSILWSLLIQFWFFVNLVKFFCYQNFIIYRSHNIIKINWCCLVFNDASGCWEFFEMCPDGFWRWFKQQILGIDLKPFFVDQKSKF